jgi:hypothetical protein
MHVFIHIYIKVIIKVIRSAGLHPQPEDAPCCEDRDPPNMDICIVKLVQGGT